MKNLSILLVLVLLLGGCAGTTQIPLEDITTDNPTPDEPAQPTTPAAPQKPEPKPEAPNQPQPPETQETIQVLNITSQGQQDRVTIGTWATYNITLLTSLGERTATMQDLTITYPANVTGYYNNTLHVLASTTEPVTIKIQLTADTNLTHTITVDAWGQPLQFPAEPTESHTLRPGINSNSCTTNFIFHYQYEKYYIGSAAHCQDDGNDNGCGRNSDEIGSLDKLENGVLSSLAYSSFESMARHGVTEQAPCLGNDFSLLEIPEDAWSLVHPKPHGALGHITGLGDCRTMNKTIQEQTMGDTVYAQGRSSLRGNLDRLTGIETSRDKPTDDKTGNLIQVRHDGFECDVYLASPAIPGDSGGPMINEAGQAIGVASTINFLYPGSNTYTNIARALEYMQEYEGWRVDLVALLPPARS